MVSLDGSISILTDAVLASSSSTQDRSYSKHNIGGGNTKKTKRWDPLRQQNGAFSRSSLSHKVDSRPTSSASETPSEDLDVFLPPASVAAAQARRNAKQQQQQRHAQQLKYNNAHVLIATSPERVHQRGRQPVIGVDVSERAGKSPPPPVTQARPRMTTMRATEVWAQATTPAGKHVSSKFTGVHTPAAAHSTLNQRPVQPPSGNGVNALAAAAACTACPEFRLTC